MLTGHDLRMIPQALQHTRRGSSIINQNTVLSLGIIIVLMPLAISSALGRVTGSVDAMSDHYVLGMLEDGTPKDDWGGWVAVTLDHGTTIAAALNREGDRHGATRSARPRRGCGVASGCCRATAHYVGVVGRHPANRSRASRRRAPRASAAAVGTVLCRQPAAGNVHPGDRPGRRL